MKKITIPFLALSIRYVHVKNMKGSKTVCTWMESKQ
jgi:hypothetical protein